MNQITVDRIIVHEKQELNRSITRQNRKKIALAQIHSNPGNIAGNTNSIIKAIDNARAQGASTILFPELMIPGYCAMDLLYNQAFLKLNAEALKKIVEHSKGLTVICGCVDQDPSRVTAGGKPFIHNAAAIIHDGKLIAIQHKELLPTYDIFDEKRYFAPAEKRNVIEIDGIKFGIAICEDLWAKANNRDIVKDLVDAGAEVILSLNASPYSVGKLETRLNIVAESAQQNNVPILYTNLVGGQDGYDGEVIFDGNSFVLNQSGQIVSKAESFVDEIKIIDLDFLNETISLENSPDNIGQIHDALVLGLKEFFSRKGMQKAYIGLSGGIDSAVVAAIAVTALGKENVIGITMPSHITSVDTKNDAFELAERLGIECIERPILNEYNAWLEESIRVNNKTPSSLTRQNKQARIRMSILMEYTNETPDSCHLNTGNKTEIALGYFTLNGDSSGGISVLGDVDKLRVYELAKFCNRLANKDVIPVTTISRSPTAELEVDQTDAASLPADYDVLVPLVNKIIETDFSYEELVKEYGQVTVDRTLGLIRRSEAKRRQLPPAIRITDKSFGIERRIPMDYPLEQI